MWSTLERIQTSWSCSEAKIIKLFRFSPQSRIELLEIFQILCRLLCVNNGKKKLCFSFTPRRAVFYYAWNFFWIKVCTFSSLMWVFFDFLSFSKNNSTKNKYKEERKFEKFFTQHFRAKFDLTFLGSVRTFFVIFFLTSKNFIIASLTSFACEFSTFLQHAEELHHHHHWQ